MICCCCYCHPLSFSQKTVKKNKKGRKRETTALHSIVALQNCWWFCWLGDQNPLLLTTESPGAIIKNTYGRAANITILLLCTNPSEDRPAVVLLRTATISIYSSQNHLICGSHPKQSSVYHLLIKCIISLYYYSLLTYSHSSSTTTAGTWWYP